MTELLVFLALLLALVALERARGADRRAREALARLSLLEARLAGTAPLANGPIADGALPHPADAAPPTPAAPRPPGPALWPEDVRPAVPVQTEVSPPIRPRGPSIWGPEFSRARISVIGGALVLFGLAFTLRALGLPAWTLLLAVFAFGALLYGVARHTPQPVSGALRGLGYGVAALGVGSLAQRLPDDWGPGAVMLGQLGLSAALAWDGHRRREPLLGALAVGGAALGVWLLADDLGRASILAAGTVLVLAGVAVAGGRAALVGAPEEPNTVPSTGSPATTAPDTLAGSATEWRAALALTLGVAGALPLGWLVASAEHQSRLGRDFPARMLALDTDPYAGLLSWAVFGVLALAPTLALLRGPALPARSWGDARLRLAGVWAGLAPYVPVVLAVGVGLNEGALNLNLLGPVLALLLGLLGAAAWAWQHARPSADAAGPDGSPEAGLPGALAGALTAATTGVTGAALVALLGLRSQPSALAGVALALLLLGVHGRSRIWLRLGALGLAITALWGAVADAGWALGALPAVIGLAGALRLAADRWVMAPRPVQAAGDQPASLQLSPQLRMPRRSAFLLAAVCSLALIAALGDGGPWFLLAGTLALSAAAWGAPAVAAGRQVPARRWPSPDILRAATLPGLTLGGLWLLGSVAGGPFALAALLGSSVAGVTLLWHAQRAVWEGLALALLTAALALGLGNRAPGLGLPAAAAGVALLSALLPRHLPALRVNVLLLVGAVGGWISVLAGAASRPGLNLVVEVGTLLLLAVWFLLRTPQGQARLRAAFPFTGRALHSLPPLPAVPRPLWLAALLAPPLLGLSVFLPALGDLWYTLSSVAMLLVGLRACVWAHRQGAAPDARARWTAGLAVMIAAGLKGATLDALVWALPGVAAGLAVLVSGLSLLLLAILAPRPPAAPAAAVEPAPLG